MMFDINKPTWLTELIGRFRASLKTSIFEKEKGIMNKEQILEALQKEVAGYNKIIATEKGDWIVKGFIDIYKKIYTISIDTKVVSKVIELLLIPTFVEFAKKYDLILELPPHTDTELFKNKQKATLKALILL